MILIILVIDSSHNLNQGFEFIKAMYKYQRLEYYNHRKAKITLIVSTYLSMVILLLGVMNAVFISYCMAAHEEWNK